MAGKGGQRPIKGFRPGKEPPQLRKRRAKQEFGGDDAAQQRLVELFSTRTPEESRTLMRWWRLGLVSGGIALSVAGALLYGWSVIAGIVVHVLAVALFFLWFQLRRQREALEAMAELVGKGGSGRGKKSKRRGG